MSDQNMHVTCMGCACNVHTVRMDVHVTCMGCACNVHTVCMEYACYMHGISNNPCMLHAWLPRHRQPCMQHAWSCDMHELCMFHACQTPEKRPNFLRVTGKYHACLREHAWYMHVLIHYLVSGRKLPCTFHAWNSTPVIVCYTQGTCMFQVLHFE